MKNKIKKYIFFATFIISILLLLYLCNFVYTIFENKIKLENSFKQDTIFSISKIVLFSSAFADSNLNTNTSTTIKNLFQFTDIAIFIDQNSSEFDSSNTLKSVSIENITFNTKPNLGNPNLYFKDLTTFATAKISEDNLINTDLKFEVTSNNEIDYSKPILYNNCANPITLCYKNNNLISEYTISNQTISYNGSLLKDCNIILNNLKCNLSFYIIIENNLGHKYRCPINIDIPLSNDTSSIFDGSYTYIYYPNYSFYLYT